MGVTLLPRKLKDNRYSLFLKNNRPGGKQEYKFLNLYLKDFKGKNFKQYLRTAKGMDAETLAEARMQMENAAHDLQFKKYNTISVITKQKIKLVDFMRSIINSGQRKGKTWQSTLNYIEKFSLGQVKLSEIDDTWLESFKDFILEIEHLSHNSKWTLNKTVRAVIGLAFKKKLIPSADFVRQADKIQYIKTPKNFLSIDEIEKLVKTPLPAFVGNRAKPERYQEFSDAFIFSCFTGIRIGDIVELTWDKISDDGQLKIVQQKTGESLEIPLHPTALEILLRKKKGQKISMKIFGEFPSRSHANEFLRRWAKGAGITKHIDFHTGRHSFVSVLIESGVDLFTVSKLAGHRRISTTADTYAHLLDSTKKKAIAQIRQVKLLRAVEK